MRRSARRVVAGRWARHGRVASGAPARDVVRAALQKLQRTLDGHPDLVALGVGFKHSRRTRYGPKLRVAVKAFVRRKRLRVSRDRRLPQRIQVVVGGRHVSVPVDIEETHGLRPQLRVVCRPGPGVLVQCEDKSLHQPCGSVGAFFRDADDPSVVFMLTAGHTFAPLGQLAASRDVEIGRWARVPADADEACSMQVDEVVSGGLLRRTATWFEGAAGGLVDIALIRLPAVVPPILRTAPWTQGPARVASESALRRAIDDAGRQLSLLAYTASGVKLLLTDSFVDPPSADVIDVDGTSYATTLLMSRPLGASDVTFGGDSGAPIYTEDGSELVGFHILGNGQSDPADARSICLLAESAIAEIRWRTGLRLVPVAL